MTASRWTHAAYRLILRCHPMAFRERFQDEMLWVFEEQARHEHAGVLLLDALRSCLVHHAQAHHSAEPMRAGFTLEVATSSLSSTRLLQAAIGAAAISMGFAALLAKGAPTMPTASWPVTARRYVPSPCDEPVVLSHPSRNVRSIRKPLASGSK